MPRDLDLLRDVVFADADVSGRCREDLRGLAGREPSQLGNVGLDDEEAAWFQMVRGVAEARDLFVLRSQVGDRVA